MAVQSSGVTVTFKSEDSNTILTIEGDMDGDTKPAYGTGWVGVWTGGRTGVVVSSTSGRGVTLVNQSITKQSASSCSFNKSRTAQLPHSNLSGVVITQMGSFIDSTGKTIANVPIVVNLATGELTTNVECYGTVAASYTTTYSRYSSPFVEDPNAATTKSGSKYCDMVVVAFCGADQASVTLNGPSEDDDPNKKKKNNFDSGKSSPNNGGAGTKIQIELTTPVRLSTLNSGVYTNGYACYAEIDVYFGGSANAKSVTPTVSEGTIDTLVGEAPSTSVDIKGEQITWVNNAVANTHYLPATTPVSVTLLSPSLTPRYGSGLIPTFESSEGGSVQPKVFIDGSSAYTMGEPRKTLYGDVVVTEFGLAVDCTGSATVDYTTSKKRYGIWWHRPAQVGGVTKWFRPLTVWVTSGQYSGTLVINPPSDKGNK